MTSFPTDDLTVANLDGTADDPSQGRAEILAAINKIKTIIASFGGPSGICPLDATGFVADANINATAMTALLDVVTTSLKGLMSAADKTKLNGIATGANLYTLPTASATVLGGVKVGSNLSIASGVLTANSQIAAHAAGSYVMQGVNDGTVGKFTATTSTTLTEVYEWKIARAGTIRVRIGAVHFPHSETNYWSKTLVYKNDVLVNSVQSTSTAFAYLNVDIAVDICDTIQIKVAHQYYFGITGIFHYAVIMTDTPSDAAHLYTYTD